MFLTFRTYFCGCRRFVTLDQVNDRASKAKEKRTLTREATLHLYVSRELSVLPAFRRVLTRLAAFICRCAPSGTALRCTLRTVRTAKKTPMPG